MVDALEDDFSNGHPWGWLCEPETVGYGFASLGLIQCQFKIPYTTGSAAKAAYSLERFCPNFSMAPVLAIV